MNTAAAARFAATLATLAALALPAPAQTTVYRCGADGREYTSTPCTGGRAIAIDDSRSDEQRREALAVAALTRREAASLAQEREQRERQALAQRAASLGGERRALQVGLPAPKPAHKPKRRKGHALPEDPNLSPVWRGGRLAQSN